jgi:hypothetical protein
LRQFTPVGLTFMYAAPWMFLRLGLREAIVAAND